MASDERLKKVQGAGADFLETARTRAEEFLRELSRAGVDTQGRAQGALDDLMEGGRKGTEQMVTLIRKEITNQLSLLGLATKDDLAALERRLGGTAAAKKSAAPARKTAARKTTGATRTAAAPKSSAATRTTTANKTSAATRATGAGATAKSATAKSTARKAPAARKSAASKKAAG